VVLQQCGGPAGEEEDHRAAEGLPRHDAGVGRPHGPAVVHKNFDVPLPGILHTDAPYYYRGAQPGESQEDYATRLANNLEQLILREDPDTIAAFFAEPLMGVGGVLLPPKTYFEKIQAVLAKYDVLLIDDEVITGFGRTGEIWGAQAFGMQPNTVTARRRCRRLTCRSAPSSCRNSSTSR